MLRLTNLALPLHHADEAISAAIVRDLRITPPDLVRHLAAEGAGYAGGILSAAVDGFKVTEAVCESLCRSR